jgi:hypothetical protein
VDLFVLLSVRPGTCCVCQPRATAPLHTHTLFLYQLSRSCVVLFFASCSAKGGAGRKEALECIVIATGAVVGPARAGDCRFIEHTVLWSVAGL